MPVVLVKSFTEDGCTTTENGLESNSFEDPEQEAFLARSDIESQSMISEQAPSSYKGDFNRPSFFCPLFVDTPVIQKSRIFFSILGSIIVAIPLWFNGPFYTLKYATQWSSILFTLSMIASYRSCADSTNRSKLRQAQIINHVALTFEFCSCVVFLAIVAPIFIPQVGNLWRVALVSAHTVPLILILLNYFMTDSVVRVKDWW